MRYIAQHRIAITAGDADARLARLEHAHAIALMGAKCPAVRRTYVVGGSHTSSASADIGMHLAATAADSDSTTIRTGSYVEITTEFSALYGCQMLN